MLFYLKDPAAQESLTEEETDAMEELKQLSDVTGTFYLVTGAFETGTYVVDGVMTIKREDLSKGAYYAIGKKAYYMMQQLDPEKGEVVKDFLMKEIEQMIGADGIEAKKKNLRQQGVGEDMLVDEICAEMMPTVFLQGNFKAVEELATLDPKAAEKLRDVIGSIREHLAEEYVDHAPEPEAVKGTGIVRFEEGVKATSRRQRLAVAYAKHIASAIGIDIVFYDSTVPGTFGRDANGYFFGKDNSIHLDLQKAEAGKGTVLFTLSHELVHFAQKFSAEKYNALADFLVENYGTDTMEQLIQNKMKQLKTDDRDLAKSEVIADACERMLIDSDAMIKLQALKERDAGLWETIKEHIRNLMEKVRAMFANVSPTTPEGVALQEMTDVLEQATAMFEDMVVDAAVTYQQTGGETLVDEGVLWQAKHSKKDARYLDPRTVTQDDVREMLQGVMDGIYFDDTYITIRANTPPKLIYWAKIKRGDVIENNPFAMSVKKAYGSMNRIGENIDGTIRALSVDDMIALIKAMGDPSYIVYQEANDRYVEVVNFENENKKRVFAVVEIGNDKNAVHMNGYESGMYNVLVTTFPPDKGVLQELLNNKNNQIIYDKQKDASQRTSGSTVPSVLNDTPFCNDSISQNGSNSQDYNELNFQKKQNFSSTKTFSEAMADTVSKETTELYDRLTEAIKQHYAEENAAYDDFDLETEIDLETLPAKVQKYIRDSKNELLTSLGFRTRGKHDEWVISIVDKMADEYLLHGEISERAAQMLHDAAVTYQQTGGETLVDGEVKFSLKKDRNGNTYWQIETGKDIFKNLSTPKQFEAAAFNYILGQRDNNKIVEAIDGKKMSFIRLSAREFTNSDESQMLKDADPIMFAQKMRLLPSLEDLAANASVNWHSPDHKNHKLFKERGFENFRGRVGIDNVIFNFVIRAGKAHFGDVFYDINLEVDSILPHAIGTSGIQKPTSKSNISNSSQNVNIQKQKKQNFSSTKTFSEAMADTVSQETTELYDRLTEALDKHYGIRQAVGTDFNPSVDVEGSSFVYTDSNTARKKIEAKIKQFKNENELTPDEIKYCEQVAKDGPIVEMPDTSKAEIYDELIQLYMDLEVPESSVEYNQPKFEDMTEEEREQWFADWKNDVHKINA